MNTGTMAISVAVLASFGGIFWSRASLLKDLEAIEVRLAEVHSGIQPIHLRCETLGVQLSSVETEVAKLSTSSSDSTRALLAHETLLQAKEGRIDQLGQSLADVEVRYREGVESLRFALDDESLKAGELETKLAQQAAQLELLGAQLEWVPEGTILPWLPNENGLPEGWLICDGSYGTPDLRDQFLRGVTRFEEAGAYGRSAGMSPSGVHSHFTDPTRSNHNLTRTGPKQVGDWLILFDTGVDGTDAESLALHGSHVHEDEHVPANFSVVFIMRAPRSGL